MPLLFITQQIERPMLTDRGAMRRDLQEHLLEVRPALFRIYPLPYLRWVVDDTLDLVAPFKLNTVPAQRMFLQIRFDIEASSIEFKNGAPDFSKYTADGQHDLWQVTGDVSKDESNQLF